MVINGSSGSGGPVTSNGAAWLVGGNNNAATSNFGNTSNQHIDVITNSAVRGRITNTGQFVWGANTPSSTTAAGVFMASSGFPFGLSSYAPSGSTGAIVGVTGPGNTTGQPSIYGNNVGAGTGSGVHGNFSSTTTSTLVSGVQGVYSATSTSSGGVGVIGFNNADFSGNHTRTGVLGLYASTNAYGIGVIGVGFGGAFPTSTTTDYGVVGWVGNNSNYSGYFNGNHVVSNGTKSGSVPTSKGNQLLYVTETPEVWFEDIGGGQLVNGEATVNLDPLFLETVVIDNNHPMRVFVQMEGESKEVYVIKSGSSFKVKERNNGTSNAAFSYRVMAKRIHFQDHRFGNDPVWGAGDTRQYFSYATPPAIDYNQNLLIQEQKRKAAPATLPPGLIPASELSKQLDSNKPGSR